MKYTIYNEESDRLSDKDAAIAKVLLENKKGILHQLAEAGIHEDETTPYVYYVPTGLSFDIGDLAKGYPIRSLWAVVMMARASYANACSPTSWAESALNACCISIRATEGM